MGETVRIQLELDAFPDPFNFTWFFNGQPLVLRPGLNFGLTFIEFDGVNIADAGNYTVRATNIAGTGTFGIALTVLGMFKNISITNTRRHLSSVCL